MVVCFPGVVGILVGEVFAPVELAVVVVVGVNVLVLEAIVVVNVLVAIIEGVLVASGGTFLEERNTCARKMRAESAPFEIFVPIDDRCFELVTNA